MEGSYEPKKVFYGPLLAEELEQFVEKAQVAASGHVPRAVEKLSFVFV